jgi:hypothetical protein
MVVNLCIGMITPPLGVNLYVAAGHSWSIEVGIDALSRSRPLPRRQSWSSRDEATDGACPILNEIRLGIIV